MLRIDVPSDGPSGLTFTELQKYTIPPPESGFNAEINDDVVLAFEDEQQAIDYAHSLDVYADSIDHNSQEYVIISDIIKAISDDEFIQAYIQS
jgi:hypothetical protein